MSVINANPLLAAAGADGYQISRSVRLRSSASAYLNRTFTTPTSGSKFTYSFWCKRGDLTNAQELLGTIAGDGYHDDITFNPTTGQTLQVSAYSALNTRSCNVYATAEFRDPSAWYHFVVVVDTTQSTSTNRVKIFQNGVQLTLTFSTTPTQNLVFRGFNANNVVHRIGTDGNSAKKYDGYLTEVNFIDGQTPNTTTRTVGGVTQTVLTEFGEFDAVTDVWKPKKYTGTYGTNGFYLPFSDNASLTRLGFDQRSGVQHVLIAESDGTAQTVVGVGACRISTISTTNYSLPSATNEYLSVTFDSPVPVTSSLKIYMDVNSTWANGRNLYINGTQVSSGNISVATVSGMQEWTINYAAHGVSSLVSLTTPQNSAGRAFFYGISVDGTTVYQTANDWTTNNISVTAGVTYDSMLDVPTPYADGGNGRGNYCVISPIDKNLATVSDGNLRITGAGGLYQANGSMAFPISGKWYFEATVSANSNSLNGLLVGIASPTRVVGASIAAAGTYGYYASNGGGIYSNGSVVASGLPVLNSTYTYQVAVDVDNGKAWIGYNTGSTQYWYNSTGGTTGDPAAGTNPTFTVALAGFFPLFQVDSASGYFWYANFGQRPFAQSAPTGFKALNTQNLPDSTIKKGSQYFDVQTWSGDGVNGRTITSTVDTVDLAWVKKRNGIDDHRIANSVLGGNKHLKSNATDAESTGTTVIQAFSGSTFTVGSDNSVNASGGTYVGWTWKESVSSGFDIVTYTGNGSSQNIAHSLGVAPKMMIVKKRNLTGNWPVYHASLGNATSPFLNLPNAANSQPNLWNSTTPTPSVFSVGNDGETNTSTHTYVAYLFSEVLGFSKFGSYTGNGAADGPFVYCGFRPRYILVKNSNDGTTNWIVVDTSTAPYNATAEYSIPNSSSSSPTGTLLFDILSNGFKCRLVSTGANGSGNTMIFAAFAENPFKNSLAR